jgi:phosphatidylinositol alpha-1,6-mannosyltransferase
MPTRNLPGNISEGYGIVFLEAGLFRVPCIGGNAGGVPEAVDDGITGILVDGNSNTSISQAILRLLNDPGQRREMGENGYRKATGFSWSDRSIKYQEFLDTLL